MSPEIIDFQQYLHKENLNNIKLIHREESSLGHVLEIYAISPLSNINCGICTNKAIFLTFEKSHAGEKSADPSCKDHSPEIFFEYFSNI